MVIDWPSNLIEEIAYRRCILFLGAGISATAVNDEGESPKTWGDFIEGAISLMRQPSPRTVDFVRKMLEQKNYLMALQTIYDNCDPGEYGNYLRQVYSRPNYKASRIHKMIKEIDSKIVITTNFDKIYDNLCNEHVYTVAQYTETEKILTNLKSTENVIIKAHGTIDDVDKVVFTQRQYYNAKKDHPQFYNLLHALFLTHTVLFLGYSLNDPDINLVLETVAHSSTPSSPHYIVLKVGSEDPEIIQHWKNCYNIVALEYGPDHSDLAKNVEDLLTRVIQYREMKRIP
jgi:NAD-dependent SIR2 family protein deacetylase